MNGYLLKTSFSILKSRNFTENPQIHHFPWLYSKNCYWRLRGMNAIRQEKVTRMRHEGFGYKKIAQTLGMSVNTVKSYCRRHELGGNVAILPDSDKSLCRNCKKPISQLPGCKKRVFCSDACRITWWNAHPEMVKRKAVYPFTCACCGKDFKSYGNRNRKYCSHSCYVSDRFGKQQL